MSDPVQTLSYFARRLIQFEQKFARRDPEKLRGTAALFRKAGEGLDQLPKAFEQGASLDPACALLQAILPGLEAEIYAEIGSPEAENLASALREAVQPGI